MPAALRGQRRKASRFESGPGHDGNVDAITYGLCERALAYADEDDL
jgi:hypothetical protein